jgi:hypothetical protein
VAGRLAILPGNRASATRRSRTPVKKDAFAQRAFHHDLLSAYPLYESCSSFFCGEKQRAAGIDTSSRAGGVGHFHSPVLKSLARLMGT